MFPHLTVEGNVAFPTEQKDIQKEMLARSLVKPLQVLGYQNSKINTRSNYREDRLHVSLARSLTRRPKLLLLDEPTSALDVESVNQIHQILHRLDTTLLLVSHDPVEVLKLSDYIIALERNRSFSLATWNQSFNSLQAHG